MAEPGEYRLELPAFQFGKEMQLDSGVEKVDIVDLSDLEHFAVRIIDSESSHPIGMAQFMSYRLGEQQGAVRALAFSLPQARALDPVPLFVRPGRYHFVCTDVLGGKVDEAAELMSGVHEIALKSSRRVSVSAEVTIVLECNDVKWPLPYWWWGGISIKNTDGDVVKPITFRPVSTGFAQAYACCTFILNCEGDVTFEFPPIQDMREIQSLTLTASRSASTVFPLILLQDF